MEKRSTEKVEPTEIVAATANSIIKMEAYTVDELTESQGTVRDRAKTVPLPPEKKPY